MSYLDKNVAKEMSLGNELGVGGGIRFYTEDDFEDIIDEETGEIMVDEFGDPMVTMVGGLPEEVYNSEECRLLDAIATAMLSPVDLGDCIPVTESDADDFAAMLNSLMSAKTEEEFNVVLSCYGSLIQVPGVKEYAEFKKGQQRSA